MSSINNLLILDVLAREQIVLYYTLLVAEMVAGNVLSRGVFVVAAKRTPFGTFGGSLKAHSPTDLAV